MASFALQGFNHTGMIVTDLDRAIGFFRDLLGFEVISRAPRDPALIGRLTRLPAPRSTFRGAWRRRARPTS